MTGLLLIAELIALFFLSRSLTERLFGFVFTVTRSRPFSVSLLTLLLFPGTVIHELAHLFTAEILGVRTGKLTLAPEAIRGSLPADRQEIQTGSVAISPTGPFRRTLIGLAPLVWGLAAFTASSYWLSQLTPQLPHSKYLLALVIYLLFTISNSMFPSHEDMHGVPATIITISLFLISAYIVGFRFSLSGQALELTQRIVFALLQSTTLVLALNGIILLTVRFLIVLLTSFQNLKKPVRR